MISISIHVFVRCTVLQLMISVFVTGSSNKSAFQEMHFYAEILCFDMEENGKCVEKIPLLRHGSRIECASLCFEDQRCIGASVDSDNSCFKHYNDSCFDDKKCNDGALKSQHVYMSKGCDNGGTWQTDTNSCKCRNGWAGASCQNHPKDCLDLKRSDYTEGMYKVELDLYQNGSNLITTVCYTGDDNDDYFMEIMYNPGEATFNRSWIDYRDGFINEDTDLFWIGFKHWKSLNDFGYQELYLSIVVEDVGFIYRTYSGFSVEGESENFRFTFESTEEDQYFLAEPFTNMGFYLGDCFGPYNNTPFTTYDRDHDEQSGYNCASFLGSAWWFRECQQVCHLLGWSSEFWDHELPQQRARILGFNMSALQDYSMSIALLLTN